jgi:hypothetical protein
LDGSESDIDCGGGYCSGCRAGKHCNSGIDCAPGHFCDKAQDPPLCAHF